MPGLLGTSLNTDDILETLRGIGRGLNFGGTSGMIGAPVDMATAVLNNPGLLHPGLLGVQGLGIKDPVGGSKWIEQKLQNQGLLPQRQGNWQEGVGELASTFVNPMTAAAVAGPKLYAAEQRAIENAMAPTTLNKQAGAIVWQGSPHKFEKLDPSKIGTGEGAQSYGNGMYVAEQKAVGQEYAKRLSKDGTGYLYKIDIPDEHIAKMLDWDKPLSQQPQAIQDAVKPLLKDVFDVRGYKGGWGSLEPDADAIRDVFTKTGHPLGTYSAKDVDALNFSGSAIVKALGNMDSESAATAQLLRKQGLTGIRYLDGGSRGAGAGSSNFVVFPGNEDLLRILERNGQPIGLLGR